METCRASLFSVYDWFLQQRTQRQVSPHLPVPRSCDAITPVSPRQGDSPQRDNGRHGDQGQDHAQDAQLVDSAAFPHVPTHAGFTLRGKHSSSGLCYAEVIRHLHYLPQ